RGTLHACLAHGLPIITTVPRVHIPALQDGKNLLLAPPQNPAALAEAILRLWHEPDLRLHLGRQAAALAAEFSWERIAGHTAELFRQLATEKV
ncbi:MAG: glycosyltransferase, partial [Chloroflexota bacterium]|nr:glycosyltransferase [Chloroflexota bacterium]